MARHLPAHSPELQAEIPIAGWNNLMGSEAAFAHGRLFAFGTTPAGGHGLFEIDAAAIRRVELDRNGDRAALPVARSGGGFAAAWAPTGGGRPLEVALADASWKVERRVTIPEAVGTDSLGRLRAAGDAVAVGWRGQAGDRWVSDTDVILPDGVLLRIHEDLLEACGEVLLFPNDTRDATGLRALDASTGRELWAKPLGEAGGRSFVGATGDAFVVVEHGRHLGETFRVRAFDAATGAERWQHDAPSYVSDLLVTDRVVAVVTRDWTARSATRVLDARTGVPLSTAPRPEAQRNLVRPILADETFVLWSTFNWLWCETHGGERAWRLRVPGEGAHGGDPFHGAACAGGRLALRFAHRILLFG